MPNIEITNNTTNGFRFFNPEYQDEIITGTSETYVAGTLLGRITTGGKLTKYTSGAANGSQNPIAILAEDIIFTGTQDYATRVLISGQVRGGELVAHGVGAITKAEEDKLRDFTIIARKTTQQAKLDNQ
jgi:hypothetical protein